MSDRPGAEKFHDDHKQMCEICRGMEEALIEAHSRLSDRVAELAECKEGRDHFENAGAALRTEVERLGALAEQRLKDREYWQERNAEKETENDRLRKDLARADSDAQALYEAEVERLRAALDRAGDRLAQVQPGVTEAWAYDIIPKAEQEIAAALAEEKE
jgi:hypothetical protein